VNYELAKQLKDAGFPQGVTDGSEYYGPGGVYHRHRSDYTMPIEWWYIPTLSELIAELGNDLIMWHSPQGWHVSRQLSIDKWPSSPPNEIIEAEITEKELDVALAKLWLSLNQKSDDRSNL
jgi:hypothetical protein